jgi:hypothetical protein
MRLRLTIVLPALLVAGCDPFYGVESRATLSGPVDVRCVNAALASVPDVGRVTYERSESRSTEILPKQRKVLTVAHDWLYGEGGADILEIIQSPDGWSLRNSRSRMGVAVPHDEMARFVPLMQKVNQAIELRCGLPVAHLKAEPVGETKPQEL